MNVPQDCFGGAAQSHGTRESDQLQHPRHKTHYPAAASGDTKSPSVEFRGSTVAYAFSTCNHLGELRERSEHTREKPRERSTH